MMFAQYPTDEIEWAPPPTGTRVAPRSDVKIQGFLILGGMVAVGVLVGRSVSKNKSRGAVVGGALGGTAFVGYALSNLGEWY